MRYRFISFVLAFMLFPLFLVACEKNVPPAEKIFPDGIYHCRSECDGKTMEFEIVVSEKIRLTPTAQDGFFAEFDGKEFTICAENDSYPLPDGNIRTVLHVFSLSGDSITKVGKATGSNVKADLLTVVFGERTVFIYTERQNSLPLRITCGDLTVDILSYDLPVSDTPADK